MFILRLLSLLLVVVALMLLGYDAWSWVQHNGEPDYKLTLTSLGAAIDMVAHMDYANNPPGPDFVQTVFKWPSWAVIGVVGVVLALLFRRRD